MGAQPAQARMRTAEGLHKRLRLQLAHAPYPTVPALGFELLFSC